MTDQEFYNLVKQLRERQKAYFKTRDLKSLEESKRMERLLDEEIKKRDKQANTEAKEAFEKRQLSLQL